MAGWHHLLIGPKFEQALGDGEGQRGLECWCAWGCKELDMTEQLNNTSTSEHLQNLHRILYPSLILSHFCTRGWSPARQHFPPMQGARDGSGRGGGVV